MLLMIFGKYNHRADGSWKWCSNAAEDIFYLPSCTVICYYRAGGFGPLSCSISPLFYVTHR